MDVGPATTPQHKEVARRFLMHVEDYWGTEPVEALEVWRPQRSRGAWVDRFGLRQSQGWRRPNDGARVQHFPDGHLPLLLVFRVVGVAQPVAGTRDRILNGIIV